jgi:hypothetical protein
MLKRKSNQLSLLELHYYLPEKLQKKLHSSWAHVFRGDIIPAIPEKEFKNLYSEDEGRPCIPVAILIGLSIIKEFFNCTDSALIE